MENGGVSTTLKFAYITTIVNILSWYKPHLVNEEEKQSRLKQNSSTSFEIIRDCLPNFITHINQLTSYPAGPKRFFASALSASFDFPADLPAARGFFPDVLVLLAIIARLSTLSDFTAANKNKKICRTTRNLVNRVILSLTQYYQFIQYNLIDFRRRNSLQAARQRRNSLHKQ